MSQRVMAARVGASRPTIVHLEHGDASVNLSVLARALMVLGLDADLDLTARADDIGRRLQDLDLPQKPHPRERTVAT